MSEFPTSIRSFDGKVLPGQQIAWPRQPEPGEKPLRFEPGNTTLVYLRHAPRRLFRRTDPIHESLVIEMDRPLTEIQLGQAIPVSRLVYQAGTEILMYRSVQASGSVKLVRPAVLDVELTFTSPIVDHENKGDISLSGRVNLNL